MRGRISRYISVGGCPDDAKGIIPAVAHSLRSLIGLVGESGVRLQIKEGGETCIIRVVLRDGGLLDAVLLAIALSRVDGRYLRPMRVSGTVRGLRERLNAPSGRCERGDEGKPSQSDG